MLIPPKYFLTHQISKLISILEANKEVIENINIPFEVEQNIRRKTTLASSLFSARIEGNPLTIEDLATVSNKDIKKLEVDNILRAINWIRERNKKDITIKDIFTLHEFVMKSIQFEELGQFRKKHEGIFTSTGAVVYHAPPPSMIDKLIKRLLKYVNSDKEMFVPIRAIIAHYIFEKIHPFTDGSGRVGRLLLLMVLSKGGYGYKGIIPFEEKIDKKRETYYKMLEEPERDITSYLEFMLEVLVDASTVAKKEILDKKTVTKYDELLPRRLEIFNIIKDHKIVNLNFLQRRFAKVNARTLRYDIKKLVDLNFIRKMGTTKGVYYSVKEN